MREQPTPLGIVLTPDGPVPIYLQIKSQVSYLITSGQLPPGTRLPPVRTVAQGLGVNPGTVAQAYRELQFEGLIDAAVGRGTFVAPTIPVPRDLGVRQREAAKALETALARLRALALPDSEVRLLFEATLAANDGPCHVVLAAPTRAIADKYAASLVGHLGAEVAPHPVTFEELERGDPSVGELLDLCYFVVTFASSVRRVEVAAERYGRPFQVLGMTTQVQDDAIAALGRLPSGAKAVVLSEERYAHQSLNLVLKHSPLAPEAVQVVTLELLERELAGLRKRHGTGPRVLVHTFGAADRAKELASRFDVVMELRFDVAPDSLARLRALLLRG